jgi:hypothetical protein
MQAIFHNTDEWLTFAHHAWQAAGSPTDLDPHTLMTSPVAYNRATYSWLETRYRTSYRQLFQMISPESRLMQQQPEPFQRRWRIHYDPITIWKQVCPLFVFGDALEGVKQRHIRLAAAYTIGYGIPIMAVDQMLDALPHARQDMQDWFFVLAAYALGLEQLHAAHVPARIATRFLDYTHQMHHFLWREKSSHFRLPDAVSPAVLQDYLTGDSRLLSSIFFGTTIEWAFILHQGTVPAQFKPVLPNLRRLRQLNDELVDVDDDIRYGIVTYPYLHGLASPQYGQQLAQNIRTTWELDWAGPNSSEMEQLTAQRRILLQQAGSFAATATASMNFLRTCMAAVSEQVPATSAFGVTLLLNQRLSHLVRLAQNNWQEIANVYQPDPFGPEGAWTGQRQELIPLSTIPEVLQPLQ